jgi:DNA-binding MarR family transcriptional regulator
LVERVSCPTDRRAYQLALTAEGKRAQRAADPHVLRVVEEAFGRHITDEEASTMADALERARSDLSRTVP